MRTGPMMRQYGMSAFTIVSDYENFTIWDCRIDFTRSIGLWAISGGFSGSSIRVEAIRVLIIINRNFAVFHYHAFTWKSNDTLDDVLILNRRIDTTGKFTTGFTIEKNNDLTTFWYVFLT